MVLFGPTASGKTSLLFELAHRGRDAFPGGGAWFEVVSADSMQVYRGMDIGTAKPSADERRELPHHLIDIRNPDEQFTVGDFVREAEARIREIASRGRLPVVSGGTAFYLRALLCGMPPTPPTDPAVRAGIEGELEASSLPELYHQLEQCDPVSAANIDPHDAFRIVRALEVYRVSGRPRSSFLEPRTLRAGLTCRVYAVTLDRSRLYENIDTRVERMFDAGLLEEVDRLKQAGYGADTQALRAIGYREFFADTDTSRIRAAIQRNSRRYAKRQITFSHLIPGRVEIGPGDVQTLFQGCAQTLRLLLNSRENR
ncbi:MAG: tRNA (adenosine(37)-N6)-dimethylallyltransferase MiaA [bacterium]